MMKANRSNSKIRKTLLLSLTLSVVALISVSAQTPSEETYCIKLRPPSKEKYFITSNPDSVPIKFRRLYEEGLDQWGKILSRFDEESLVHTDKQIFRSITFGPFNDAKDVQIVIIEKKGNQVDLTIKFVKKIKDSTVLVHRKTVGLEIWNKFEMLANTYFVSQPSFKNTMTAIHDGSSTVYEGRLFGKYHFIERHVISFTDPDLQEINKFLYSAIGSFSEPNCKQDTREN